MDQKLATWEEIIEVQLLEKKRGIVYCLRCILLKKKNVASY